MMVGKLSASDKVKYYYNRGNIDNSILLDASTDKHVIYGARAINAQLPSALNKPTNDWDIFSKSPKKDAFEMETELDREFGGDLFSVKKAKYKGTWKVKSNVTGDTVVDYTFPSSRVPSVNISGNKYAKLGWIKNNIRRALNNPKNAYRFEKDNEALQRINLYEKNKGFLLG